MVRLEAVLDSWKTVRADTAQSVEDMAAADLDFRPADELMTFQQIARHILDASHALTGLMLAGEEDLSGPGFRDKLKLHLSGLSDQASQAQLAAELRRALDSRCAELSARPPGFHAEMITRFDGQRVTRLEMVQYAKEHELTHRSQMFLYLRLKGIVPATTRRRQAKK